MRVVSVKFKLKDNIYNSDHYYYMTTFHVSTGEEVVVNTPDRGLQVAMVYEECVRDPRLKKLANDFLVTRIDMKPYLQSIETQSRLDGIKQEIKSMISSTDTDSLADMLDDYVRELRGLSK